MKTLFTCVCGLTVMCLFISAAGAMELKDGFMGIQWKSTANQQEGLSWLYEKENVAYYIQPHIVHTVHDIPVSNVVYGFYVDQFFAVYIRLESEEVFGEFRRYFRSKYGIPKKTVSTKTGETVYRWKHGDIKIKLKTIEENYQMKLAFYYTPLSTKLNEEQLEQFHDKSIQFLPIKKDEKPEMIPLLRF
jgi:hypothetical protein